ncbi:MAG TPA: chloride channel protein [Solirubrobacterales bacterium]|nr:chloride channel protein [Solirubrobacterales bacterium]
MADEPAGPDPASTLRSKSFLAVLVLAAIVGVIASLAAWCFLELIFYVQQWVFTDIPHDLGYDHGAPLWWYFPVLAIAGVLTAFAIVRLPGNGGHVPAEGLKASPTQPIDLPGVVLAAIASIGLGLVVGPEAPLIALGGGIGFLMVRAIRPDAPPELGTLLATSSTFAAVSFLFGSPIIAAVILIEAAGLGGSRMPLVLIPGLLAAGIGSLVSIGLGSLTGLSTADISLSPLHLPAFARPEFVDFLWTIALAAAIAVVTFAIFRLAREAQRIATPRPFIVLPIVGLLVAGLAIAFSQTTDHGVNQVLFSGQNAIGPLVENPGSWSLSALALLIALKGLAYGLSLGTFRGGPTFPAMFLGAAAGVMAAQLPGFDLTPAVAVGLGAAVVSVLRLPLSAVVLATVFTVHTGLGSGPLIIVGVVVAYMTVQALDARSTPPEPATGS